MVGRDKSAPGGIIISRIEVIELRFSIVVIASVTDGIVCGKAIGYECFGCTITPRIITILCNLGT